MKNYLFYLCLLVWPFGLLLGFKLEFLPKPIYLLDVLVGLLFLAKILNSDFRRKVSQQKIFLPLVFFLTCLFVSLLANLWRLTILEIFTSSLYLFRVFTYPILYFVALEENQKRLFQTAVFSFSIFLLLGLFQYVFLPDLRFLKFLGFDDHYYRLTGGLLDPNFTGAILSSVSLLFLLTSQYFYFFLSLASLVLTFSRASYLSFVLGILVYGFSYKNYKALLLLALLGLGVYLAPKPFGEGVNLLRTFSISSRVANWQEGLTLFSQKPIFGWGYNTLGGISNSYIYLLATSGLIGFLGFLNLLRHFFLTAQKETRIFLSIILIHSLFNNTFFLIWIFSLLWVVLALKFKEYR